MELKIYKARADFNNSPYGNTKLCVMVEFPNCIHRKTKKPFKWIPSYLQIRLIKKALSEVEGESWEK